MHPQIMCFQWSGARWDLSSSVLNDISHFINYPSFLCVAASTSAVPGHPRSPIKPGSNQQVQLQVCTSRQQWAFSQSARTIFTHLITAKDCSFEKAGFANLVNKQRRPSWILRDLIFYFFFPEGSIIKQRWRFPVFICRLSEVICSRASSLHVDVGSSCLKIVNSVPQIILLCGIGLYKSERSSCLLEGCAAGFFFTTPPAVLLRLRVPANQSCFIIEM